MARTIPIALQNNLDTATPTVTRLLRIREKNGTLHGFTMLDRPVPYDHGDGLGLLTYSSVDGFDPRTMSADNSYQVGNTEVQALVTASGSGLTAERIQAGVLDDATWTLFLVDYTNPAPGTAAILDAGDVGDVVLMYGMVWVPQLISYSMRLAQPVGDVWQRQCRAVAGTPRNSRTGCGWDVSVLWTTLTVTAVDPAESDRIFEVAETDPTGFGWFPGRLTWSTGDNASDRLYVIESVAAIPGGTRITLAQTTPYPIQVGDTGPIRPDCPKTVAGCQARDNYPNYNGENDMPVGDAAAGTWPGAQL